MPAARALRDALTDVRGIRVGHWTDRRAATGCTVVLCEAGAVGGVDVRGAAPGTRETDLMRPGNVVDRIHGVVLSGGSAFGLDAASGVMRYLSERGVGFPAGDVVVPIVPAAILFDLGIGHPRWPDAEAGYRAASRATSGGVPEGSVGAGTGATVAKLAGPARRLHGGIGTASERLDTGVTAAALVAVNAWGGIRDPRTGEVVAAPRGDEAGFLDIDAIWRAGFPQPAPVAQTEEEPAAAATRGVAAAPAGAGQNTTIGVIATDARLTREQANRLATVGHDGFARTTWPAHSQADGDALFVLATGEREIERGEYLALEAAACLAVERAVLRGVRLATGLAKTPSISEWCRA